MIVLVDQDGPIADFELGFIQQWRRNYPAAPSVEMQRRRSFKVRDDYPKEQWQRVESTYLACGFYENLPIVEGAQDALQEISALGHQVWICTSPLSQYENCILEKYRWVEKHLGKEFTKRIIATKDKTLIRGDFLIDDAPRVTGLLHPDWEHVLFDAPYNREINDRRRLKWVGWKQVLLSA